MDASSSETTGRGLKTVTQGLQALRLLGAAPAGLGADELALYLGKSKATARYLLNSLCQEGFARRVAGAYQLASTPPWGETWGASRPSGRASLPADLTDAVSELYQRTRQRTYLAHLEGERSVVVDSRGHQGLGRIPGLQERIDPNEAHALAITKALAAASPELEEVLRRDKLSAFTPNTINDSGQLTAELSQIRHNGFAIDREEYAEAFCCIAAPIRNPAGAVSASLGISVAPQCFAAGYAELVNEVIEVATIASEQWRENELAVSPSEQDDDAMAQSP